MCDATGCASGSINEWQATPDEVVAVYLDEEFWTGLSELSTTAPPTVLDLTRTGDRAVVRLHWVLSVELPERQHGSSIPTTSPGSRSPRGSSGSAPRRSSSCRTRPPGSCGRPPRPRWSRPPTGVAGRSPATCGCASRCWATRWSRRSSTASATTSRPRRPRSQPGSAERLDPLTDGADRSGRRIVRRGSGCRGVPVRPPGGTGPRTLRPRCRRILRWCRR